MIDWRKEDVAIEFHGLRDMTNFWNAFVPRLPELRLRYAAFDGRVVTTTVARDPATMLRSTYKMWPPRLTLAPGASKADGRPEEELGGGRRQTLLSFEEALLSGWARGALVAAMLDGTNYPKPGLHDRGRNTSWACAQAEVTEARRRLSTFDVVGVTECTLRHWRALGQLLRWPILTDDEIAAEVIKTQHNEYFKPAESNQDFRAFAETTADAILSDDAQAALLRATECDAPVCESLALPAALVARGRGGRVRSRDC